MTEKSANAVSKVIDQLQELQSWYSSHGLSLLTLSFRDYSTLKNHPKEAQRCGVLASGSILTYRGITLKCGPGGP